MNIFIPYMTYKSIFCLGDNYKETKIDYYHLFKNVLTITLIRGCLASLLILGYNQYIFIPLNILITMYLYKKDEADKDIMWDLNLYLIFCIYLSQAF